MMPSSKEVLEQIKRFKTLSETGLFYATNEYDKERYEELYEISLKLISTVSDVPLSRLEDLLIPTQEYPTPKIDIRGLVLRANKILMVRERADGKWALPGGWGEIGFTPSEVIVKEIHEETGLNAKAKTLLAIFDKRCHPHPAEIHYVYKMVFHCEITGGSIQSGFDIHEAAFFDINQLPELSENRILKSQIQTVYQMVLNGDLQTIFD